MINREMILGLRGAYPLTGALTLLPRIGSAGGDTFSTSVTQSECRKLDIPLETVAALGGSASEQWTTFHVWVVGQSVTPKMSDVLVESNGVRWYIRRISEDLMGAMIVCDCVAER